VLVALSKDGGRFGRLMNVSFEVDVAEGGEERLEGVVGIRVVVD